MDFGDNFKVDELSQIFRWFFHHFGNKKISEWSWVKGVLEHMARFFSLKNCAKISATGAVNCLLAAHFGLR